MKYFAKITVATTLCVLLASTWARAQAPSGNGSLLGSVTDDTGVSVAAATVGITGPVAESTRTDAHGRFDFENLPPGSYEITVAKGGYQTGKATEAVGAGQAVTIPLTIHLATLTSLRTIGTVCATRDSTFNTSTASVNVVPAQTFQEQGATQVTAVLNEVPGVQISYPGSSANGAAPGAITSPNIRNGLSYETATLIDGHPLSVGLFGDYVTTFLNPYLLQSAEIVKGPGAMAPQVNYAINGTVNFRTKIRRPTSRLSTRSAGAAAMPRSTRSASETRFWTTGSVSSWASPATTIRPRCTSPPPISIRGVVPCF